MAKRPSVPWSVSGDVTVSATKFLVSASPSTRWLVAIGVAIAIVALSVVPGKPEPGDNAFVWAVAKTPTLLQKSMHVVVYGAFTLVLAWALTASRRSLAVAGLIATALAVTFGAFLEAAQLYVPGRFGNLYDIGLNGAGALAGLLAVISLHKQHVQRHPRNHADR